VKKLQSEPDRPKRRRDREAKRHALVAAAIRLFSKKGYDSTTTREIAAEAGCAEGLIHRYFGAKSGLLLAILESLSTAKDKALFEHGAPCGSLAIELHQLTQLQLDHLWEKRDYLRVSFSQAFRDPRFGNALWSIPQRRTKLLARRLRQHKHEWSLSDDDIQTLAHAITAMSFVFGFIRPVVLGQSRTQTRNLAFKVTGLMTRALQEQEAMSQ